MKHIIILLLALSVLVSAEDYTQWKYSAKIKVNTVTAGVTANQTRFPLALRLNPATFKYFANTKASGADLRFAKSNGTHLNYQIENWKDVAGDADSAAIWVHMDTVFGSNSSQYIMMYWGNSSAVDSSRDTLVFPNDANTYFKHVMHLNEPGFDSAGNYKDATAFRYTGAGNGGMAAANRVSGVVGGACYFNGSTNYIAYSNAYNFGAGVDFSMSAWIRMTSGGAKQVITSKRPAGLPGWSMEVDENNNLFFTLDDGSSTNHAFTGTAISAAAWNHVAITFTRAGSTDSAIGYINGARVGAVGINSETLSLDGNTGINTGNRPADNDRKWSGSIDEMRVLRFIPTPGWIKLNYETQKPTQTAVSLANVSDSLLIWNSSGNTTFQDTLNWFPIRARTGKDTLMLSGLSDVECRITPPNGIIRNKVFIIDSMYSGLFRIVDGPYDTLESFIMRKGGDTLSVNLGNWHLAISKNLIHEKQKLILTGAVPVFTFIGADSSLFEDSTETTWFDIDVSKDPGAVWRTLGTQRYADLTVYGGKIFLSDSTTVMDVSFNNTGAGDTVFVSKPLLVNGTFSCAAGVIFVFSGDGKICMLTECSITDNGNTTLDGHVFYPPVGPIYYTHSNSIDTVGYPVDTMNLINAGCNWDSIRVSPALPTGYTLDTLFGFIWGTPTDTMSTTIYKIIAYNMSCDLVLQSDSCYDTITIVAAPVPVYSTGGAYYSGVNVNSGIDIRP